MFPAVVAVPVVRVDAVRVVPVDVGETVVDAVRGAIATEPVGGAGSRPRAFSATRQRFVLGGILMLEI